MGSPDPEQPEQASEDLVRLERPKAITAAVFNAEKIDAIPA
jgi:hypothetical protein